MRYIRKIGFLQILCLTLLITANDDDLNHTKRIGKRGVVENIGEGLKFAGQVFGINTAADVANLVAMAFSKNKPNFMSMFQQKQQSLNNDDSVTDASQQVDSSEEKQSSMKNEHHQKQQHQQQSDEDESDKRSKKPLHKQEFSTTQFVAAILRMIGFDASKLGALALNAIVMIAEAIGNAFLPRTHTNDGSAYSTSAYDNEDEGIPEALSRGNRDVHQPRTLREGTPIDWYLENPTKSMRSLLDDALDTKLTDRITEMIERVEQREGGQIGCIKLLMCKSSPFIWGMQRSVSERISGRETTNTTNDNVEEQKEAKSKVKKKLFSTEGLFAYFPSVEEFLEHSAICTERFGMQCNVDDKIGDKNDRTKAKNKENSSEGSKNKEE